MIRLITENRAAAIEFADQLVRNRGIKVRVYERHQLPGRFLVLDEDGIALEIKKPGAIRMLHDPERRASPRVPFRAFVQGRTIGRVGHA